MGDSFCQRENEKKFKNLLQFSHEVETALLTPAKK